MSMRRTNVSPPQSSPVTPDLLAALRTARVVQGNNARAKPLPGGGSSDVVLVEGGERRLVVKRALPKLRVQDDWFADPARNRSEAAFLRYVGEFAPAAVPRVLAEDAAGGWFA